MDKNVLVYEGDKGVRLMVKCDGETVWLTQAQMCQLFDRDVSVISRHIRNIFKEGELDPKSNLHFLQIANSDKKVAFYDLDVVISVGYRVKSIAGTRFRQWATKVLRAILLEGVKRDYRLEALQSLKDGSTEQATRLTQAGRKLAALIGDNLLSFYGIIALISTGMYVLLGRDIDPGETSRRRFCATQTRRSPEILPLFQKGERHGCEMCAPVWGAFSYSCIPLWPVVGLPVST